MALVTLEAAELDSIIVLEFMVSPSELHVTLEGLAIVRSNAAPTPDTSCTVDPLPSLKSYNTCRAVVIRFPQLPPDDDAQNVVPSQSLSTQSIRPSLSSSMLL